MTTTKDQTVAAGHSVELDPARWQELFEELMGRFARADLRRRARAFVRGLLAELPRKNCWTIAEHAGDPNPDGMQHLLARAAWDHDKARDDPRDYVVAHLGQDEAALVTDETGALKKGTHSVGVQRQHTGTAGRWRTPRPRPAWCTPPTPAMGWLTGSCACPARGPTIPTACGRSASLVGRVCDQAGPGHQDDHG